MNQAFLCCLLLIGCCGEMQGQDLNASTIADSLRKEAVAVKRMDETLIEIASPRKARLHYKRIYTILSSAGDVYASVYTFYDKFHKLNSATAILYDASGKELKKIKKNDMEDWSAEGAGTLMTDTRIKYYHFVCRSYPYTVTYEEETDLDGLFFLPQWLPQPSSAMAVEDSRLVVRAPSDYVVRYKQYNYPREAAMSEENGNKTYTWECRNRPASRTEVFGPPWRHLETCVKLAPSDFEIQGYKGNMSTWTDFGNFIHTLWLGRDQLPADAKIKVHALVDGLKDDHEKIDVLYDFLQKNSHYVGIQLGIGGWQPFDANYVYHNRYGDCKALSNFMVALLKEAGITAYSVLIKAGPADPDIDTAFACSQFNHCIAVAIAGKDSVWLECTSQTMAPGYLGRFTDDRDALLINSTGATVVHTPVYGLAENRLIRTVKGSIDSLGNLNAKMEVLYTGLEQDDIQGLINSITQKDLKERQEQSLGLSNCTITQIAYKEIRGKIPAIRETAQFDAENFASLSGNRLFLRPQPFLKFAARLPEPRQPRKNDIELNTSFQETDSLTFLLPPGFVPEKPMVTRHSAPAFGEYYFHSELKNDTLSITCHFRQNKGHYPADSFPKLAQFFSLIFRESTSDLVFVRKQ